MTVGVMDSNPARFPIDTAPCQVVPAVVHPGTSSPSMGITEVAAAAETSDAMQRIEANENICRHMPRTAMVGTREKREQE